MPERNGCVVTMLITFVVALALFSLIGISASLLEWTGQGSDGTVGATGGAKVATALITNTGYEGINDGTTSEMLRWGGAAAGTTIAVGSVCAYKQRNEKKTESEYQFWFKAFLFIFFLGACGAGLGFAGDNSTGNLWASILTGMGTGVLCGIPAYGIYRSYYPVSTENTTPPDTTQNTEGDHYPSSSCPAVYPKYEPDRNVNLSVLENYRFGTGRRRIITMIESACSKVNPTVIVSGVISLAVLYCLAVKIHRSRLLAKKRQPLIPLYDEPSVY